MFNYIRRQAVPAGCDRFVDELLADMRDLGLLDSRDDPLAVEALRQLIKVKLRMRDLRIPFVYHIPEVPAKEPARN